MHNAITIQNVSFPVVEYRGQRIVTFDMIDRAHQRPEGTARKAFNRNIHHFIEGNDFVKVSPDEYRSVIYGVEDELSKFCAGIKRTRKKSSTKITEDVTLLFEFDYLMLTKPFRDDLSWQVQRKLVSSYFRRPEVVTFHHVKIPSLNELAAMPVSEAQNVVTQACRQSRTLHGSQGSAGMNLRKRELKALRSAENLVSAMGQTDIDDTGDFDDERA